MKTELPETLSKQEKNFCELYALGQEPYAGNARLCYEEVFSKHGKTTLFDAKRLLKREDVQTYVSYLREIGNYENEELKSRLTEKLLHIIDETSTADYVDRFGTPISPAPLRSVAVQAAKTLMEMYPIKVTQESKLEVSGNEGGIVFNVIAPNPIKKDDEG